MISVGTYALTESEQRRLDSIRRLGESGSAGVAELASLLIDPSWAVRRSVVDALADLGESSLPTLLQVLLFERDNETRIAAAVDALVAVKGNAEAALFPLIDHANPAVVADIAQVLGRRRNPISVPSLVRLTNHADDNVAVGAIESLGRIGGRAAVEALIESTQSGNFFRTFPAIDVLGRSGDPRAVEPLIRLLDNPSYRPEAVRALGRSGEKAAIKPLVEMFSTASDAGVRIAAVALWDLRERFQEKSGGNAAPIDDIVRSLIGPDVIRKLAAALSASDAPEAVAICKVLGAIGGPESTPELAGALSAHPTVAVSAAGALKKIGSNAEENLLHAIRSGDAATRKVLLPLLTGFNSAPDILTCLHDADKEVCAVACETLARLGNPSVVNALFDCLQDSNLRVVHAATAAIQALGSREARELAIAASQSPLAGVRRSAVRILAYYGDSDLLAPVLAALKDEDPRVREAALQGLPYLESPMALEVLFDLAKNAVAKTRALAMRSFGQIPKASERTHSVLLRGLSDSDAWVRYYACQALGRLQYKAASKEIADMLNDEAEQVRVSAVESLSHIDTPESRATLRRAAISAELEVRRAALIGLGIAHRPEDFSIVLAAASDPDIPTRLIALSALVSFSSPQVVAALSSAAADSDDQIRSTAIKFLAGRPEQEATEVLVELLFSDKTSELARESLLVPAAGRVAGLLSVLATADDELAQLLISVLARTGRPEARAALIAAMKLPNVAARKAVPSALAARQDPELTAILQQAAVNDTDTEVRQICNLLLHE